MTESSALEILFLVLLVFFMGCVLGCLFRKLSGGIAAHPDTGGKKMSGFGWQCSPVERAGTEAPPYKDAVKTAAPLRAAVMAPASVPAAMPPAEKASAAKPKTVAKPKPAAKAAAPKASGKPSRPQGLKSARAGKADQLQRISGVGPKLEKTLQKLGFYHFDQIAAWTKDEVDWVDDHLRFKGRIERDEWIKQAKLLAAGDEARFAKLYGTGGMKGKDGQSKSGTRTRK